MSKVPMENTVLIKTPEEPDYEDKSNFKYLH